MVGLIVLAVGLGSPAGATTLLQLSTEQLARRADIILVGRVILEPKSFQGKGGRIYSKIDVTVDEYIKVSSEWEDEHQVEIEQLGGTLNGNTTYVPGMPTFRQKEKVLLFLRREADGGKWGVVGLAQGKFEIQTEPTTGREYVIENVRSEQDGKATGMQPVKRFLDSFLQEIKAYTIPEAPWEKLKKL